MSFWSTLASIAGPVVGGLVAGPAGAAIGGGLSALGSGLAQDESNTNYLRGVNDTNAANKAIADANNAEAWKRLQSTNQFNERMWEKNNAYNSPAAMLMRLRQAGLNPAAFTGESPAAQVTSQAPPQMSTPTMQAPGQTPVADYGHLMTERLYANELLKGKQIENADNSLRLSFLAQEKKNELLKQAADISNMKAKTVETQWATKKLAQDYEHFARIADDVARGVAASSDSLEQNIRIQDEQNQRAWMQESRENARLIIDQELAKANIRLSEANRSHVFNMIDIANKQELRDEKGFFKDELLRGLDFELKRLDIDSKKKQKIFNDVMMNSEIYHQGLKDRSLINGFIERAFGLGFNDVGKALRSLTGKM